MIFVCDFFVISRIVKEKEKDSYLPLKNAHPKMIACCNRSAQSSLFPTLFQSSGQCNISTDDYGKDSLGGFIMESM